MIKIICVGKIKEKFYQEAVNEYIKRLSKYTKIEIFECKDYSELNPIEIVAKEKEEIMKYISDRDYLITLEIEGNQIDSPTLATKIDQVFNTHSTITFIIGGSYGLDDEIKKKSNYALSFSKMTFPHQLFRVILLEQLYRSYKINNNESYHK